MKLDQLTSITNFCSAPNAINDREMLLPKNYASLQPVMHIQT